MTRKFHSMLFYALPYLLTIQSSRHDGNKAYKHSDEMVTFTIFFLGVCKMVTFTIFFLGVCPVGIRECTNSNTQS